MYMIHRAQTTILDEFCESVERFGFKLVSNALADLSSSDGCDVIWFKFNFNLDEAFKLMGWGLNDTQNLTTKSDLTIQDRMPQFS